MAAEHGALGILLRHFSAASKGCWRREGRERWQSGGRCLIGRHCCGVKRC